MNEQHWTVTVLHDGIAHAENVIFVTTHEDIPRDVLIRRLEHATKIAAMTVQLRHAAAEMSHRHARAYREEHPELLW